MKDVNVGDKIQTKKKHPCGTDIWEVIRVGADMKIKCTECKRIIMLSRSDFEKRVKKVIEDK
ncbi:DUF951 domain-containing protein [Hathewaya massiliensis]|uniref:DUF951 domain-containing protein n=1 Tax=Hathewaya massiliensis TaxID=1964382 RepID=UPI001156DC6F|nr:DUF951 domain-containing protein [Hathewaya massiliensis]